MRSTSDRVVVGMDPHKRSATIEVMTGEDVAARPIRGGRRTWLRIDTTWPWKDQLLAAFTRLASLPRPAT